MQDLEYETSFILLNKRYLCVKIKVKKLTKKYSVAYFCFDLRLFVNIYFKQVLTIN